MASPTRHPKSGTYRIRLAIPVHLRDTTRRLYGSRAELIANLATKDAKEAKRLAPAAAGRLRAMLEAAEGAYRGDGPALTERDVQALAGIFYAREVDRHGDDPGPAGGWEANLDGLDDQSDPDPRGNGDVTLTRHDLDPARQLLAEHSHPADAETVERLGMAIYRARRDVALLMLRRSEGDWRPDTAAARFPAREEARASVSATVPLGVLLTGFAADRGWGRPDDKPISRRLYDRKRTLARLEGFLGHDDAATVTKADAVHWKEDMQRRGLHASSVRNDLSECSAVWSWALRNGKLPEAAGNPFQGISPPKAVKRRRETRPFTDAEAAAVLDAARQETGLLRWLPWVSCLTGARLNEIVQSHKEDVTTIDGHAVLRIHDEGEGRSVKNADSRRTVPIHPALAAEGFLAYVAGLKAGSPLFPDAKPDKVFGQRAPYAGKKVSKWLKGTIGLDDPRISPSHSWRHWFTDAARRSGMAAEVRFAITGYSDRANESAGYGEGIRSMVALMADAMARVQVPVLEGLEGGSDGQGG